MDSRKTYIDHVYTVIILCFSKILWTVWRQ